MTNPQAIKELMDNYDKYRAQWIDEYGSDTGFDKWFTQQVINPNPQLT